MSDEFDFSTGMPSDEMAQYLQMFVDETGEQLDALVDVLLVLENSPTSHAELNESFRLIHSIKGASAMMGLDSITLLTHHLENHFERLRSGLRVLDRPMMNLILRCVDFLRDATDKLRQGQPLLSEPELLEELSKHLQSESYENIASDFAPVVAVSLKVNEPSNTPDASRFPSDDADSAVQNQAVSSDPIKRLIAYFAPTLELPELKAELILARVAEIGTILRMSPDRQDFPSVAVLGTFQIWVRTERDDAELRHAADVSGVDLLEIDKVAEDEWQSALENNVDSQSDQVNDSHATATEIEAPVSVVPAIEVSDSVASPGKAYQPTASDSSQQPTASQAISASAAIGADASTKVPVKAIPAEVEATESKSVVVETVRVDIQRLDKLMNLAGELIVNRARFVQLAQQMAPTFKKSGLSGQMRDLCDGLRQTVQSLRTQQYDSVNRIAAEERIVELELNIKSIEEQMQLFEVGRKSYTQLNEAIDHLLRVSDGLQRGVLDTRMVPIGPLFNRFKRTVRDIAGELNKKVSLEIQGENTELDKRMIDELGDPLNHLVRNAIDHGLESDEVRLARGKSAVGKLSLEAVHSGNNVLIYIRDDGGGINLEKVKKRAIERGLVTKFEADNMTDREIAQFIWAPGFSTADVVSDISGRGVGMDIVKTKIAELNGSIEVESKYGVGTTFLIRLPLTLAIIRSLLFRLSYGTFATPIENVREIVSIPRASIISVHGRHSIELRGEFIPLLDIDDIFDWHQTQYDYPNQEAIRDEGPSPNISVVIMAAGAKNIGLCVNELIGSDDIVVKSLDENFIAIRGLSGASILGDGSVCLLLDVVSCIDLAHERLSDRRRKSTNQHTIGSR